MSGRGKFYLTLFMLLLLFIVFEIFLFRHHGNDLRNKDLLLNQYYELRHSNPEVARKALFLLYEQNPHDQQALQELGYWYLQKGDIKNAIRYFQLAIQYHPDDLKSAFELARLYLLINQPEKALPLLKAAMASNDLTIKNEATDLVNHLSHQPMTEIHETYTTQLSQDVLVHSLAPPPHYSVCSINQPASSASALASSNAAASPPAKKMTERDKLLNEFYENKNKNRMLAWQALKTLLRLYPNDVPALKEAGYLALNEKRNGPAFDYFNQAYLLTCDPLLAMQLGYLLDGQGKHREAYYYFKLATRNPKLDERYKAEIALTNLRGVQTKILPNPYYIDLFYNPIHYSRFNLLVHPLIARLGRTINQQFQWQIYFSYRRTFDNRSGISGALPQIYQDSTSIFGIGSQISPIPHLPLVAFLEVGKARNLVPDIKPHWRGDLRGGLAFYTEWGRNAEFTFHPTFPLKYVADLYGDVIYYSRYQNWIGTLRWRPGLEVFRSFASSVDLYFRGFLIEDTQREFFNNLYEVGLGAVFIPTDRYNVAFRYEFTEGYYLPSAGSSSNPYGAKYHNNIIECDFFFRF